MKIFNVLFIFILVYCFFEYLLFNEGGLGGGGGKDMIWMLVYFKVFFILKKRWLVVEKYNGCFVGVVCCFDKWKFLWLLKLK